MPSRASRGPYRALTAAPLEGATPPTEFRLFAQGTIETSKGAFLFDRVAAFSVLAAAKRQGHRYVLDLEHGALEPGGRSDAMAYFSIALRNGELWAVDCKWTPEGAERLAARKQIFVSPAFSADEQGRVVDLINAALTSIPATFGSRELVAASRKGPLTRTGSTVVCARVLKADAAAFARMARSSRQTPSEALRVLVMSALNAAEMGPDTLQRIARVLGLKGASDAEIVAALQALVDEFGRAGTAGVDPLSEGLSVAELAAASKIADRTKRAAFVALRKARAVDRAASAKKTR